MGLFTPRLAKRRSQRNRWQRVTSLPDDPRPVHAFSFAEESPERIITKKMLEQVWNSVFHISREFAIS